MHYFICAKFTWCTLQYKDEQIALLLSTYNSEISFLGRTSDYSGTAAFSNVCAMRSWVGLWQFDPVVSQCV